MSQPLRETENYMMLTEDDGPDSKCEILWDAGHAPTSTPRSALLIRPNDEGLALIIHCDDEQIALLDFDEQAVPLLLSHGAEVDFMEGGVLVKAHVPVFDELEDVQIA